MNRKRCPMVKKQLQQRVIKLFVVSMNISLCFAGMSGVKWKETLDDATAIDQRNQDFGELKETRNLDDRDGSAVKKLELLSDAQELKKPEMEGLRTLSPQRENPQDIQLIKATVPERKFTPIADSMAAKKQNEAQQAKNLAERRSVVVARRAAYANTKAENAYKAIPEEMRKAERASLIKELGIEANAKKIRPQDVLIPDFMRQAMEVKARLDAKIPRGAEGVRDNEAYRIADKNVGMVKDIVEKWSLERINYEAKIRTLEAVDKPEDAAILRAKMEKEEEARLAAIAKVEEASSVAPKIQGQSLSVLQSDADTSKKAEESRESAFSF